VAEQPTAAVAGLARSDAAAPSEEVEATGDAEGGGGEGGEVQEVRSAGGLPTMAEVAARDLPYAELLHFRNRRKWGTAASMGDHVYGRLPGGVALPHDGEHHGVLTACRERATHYGAPRLVELLTDAGRSVHTAFGGPRLMVCNMAQEGGGPIRWSKSHASGRDADVAFFVKRDGKPEEPPGLVTFERGLTTTDETGTWTFDVERNWALVKAVLEHPGARVQWMFVATALRRAMFEYAEAQGEPEELLIRARQMVKQPGDSTPHNDHFHVRVYCEPSERIHGCRDKGVWWEWINDRDPELAKRSAAYALALRERNKEVRHDAFERIEDRRLYDASSALAEVALMDRSGELQQRAMDLLVDWRRRDAEVTWALEVYLRRPGEALAEDDLTFSGQAPVTVLPAETPYWPWSIGEGTERKAAHMRRAYLLLGRLGAESSAPFLAAALRSRRVIDEHGQKVPEALLAAEAARHVMSVELVPALIEALRHERSDVREAAAVALRRVTNHTFGRGFGGAGVDGRIEEGARLWEGWWAEHQGLDRDGLLRAGFAEAGVEVGPVWRGSELMVRLTSASKASEPVGYNADRVLGWLTASRSLLDASQGNKYARWRDYIGGGSEAGATED